MPWASSPKISLGLGPASNIEGKLSRVAATPPRSAERERESSISGRRSLVAAWWGSVELQEQVGVLGDNLRLVETLSNIVIR